MRQRKWFFNAAILRKNITRFAPVWIIYSALMLLPKLPIIGLGAILGGGTYASLVLASLDFITLALTNFIYAMVCGMVLFGDLFRSRMCNALHALPVRREGWLLTNVVTGLLFSFVPNLVLALLQIPAYYSLWYVPLLWLGAATMQYLFFFGVAVLTAYISGKRFAMALMYFLINLFSLLIYWLWDSVFASWLYGLVIDNGIFYLLCPLVHMMSFSYINTVSVQTGYWALGDGWGYLAVCAVVGLALIGLALLCCRRRNLEAAGDFLAFRAMKPVILILYSLLVALLLSSFFISIPAGLLVGFFTGLMLLERTGRVFRKKTLLGAGILMAVYLVSVLAVVFDVFGIICWVPQPQQVQSVRVTVGDQTFLTEDQNQISDIVEIHKLGVSQRNDLFKLEGLIAPEGDVTVRLDYITDTGTQRSREYDISDNSLEGNTLRRYLSSPQAVLGEILDENSDVISIQLGSGMSDNTVKNPEDIASLLDAIIADCNAGHMAQSWDYSSSFKRTAIRIAYYDPDGRMQEANIKVYNRCSNVIAWAEQHGIKLTLT